VVLDTVLAAFIATSPEAPEVPALRRVLTKIDRQLRVEVSRGDE
jgi:hypothetical protein